MNSKRQSNVKTVHKFTQNAIMKFRPTYYEQGNQRSFSQQGIMSKVSSMLSNFLGGKFSTQQRSSSSNTSNVKANIKSNDQPFNSKNRNRSLVQPKPGQTKKLQGENGNNKSLSKNIKTGEKEPKSIVEPPNNLQEIETKGQSNKNRLSILQKISSDTFLIGNQNQVDSITISGIYEGQIDSQINWSLNIHKKINKLAVDNKKCLLALECQEEILIYGYDLKKIKWPPVFNTKATLLGPSTFILFLRDNLIGVFYPTNATIFQLEENNKLRLIFNKKYGISEQLELFQILKPIDSSLNIFFTKQQSKAAIITLWRLQFEFKNTSNQNGGFKSLLKIYDIPKDLLSSLRIDNFSKNIFIMNFKFQILAAKDGYIIDSANTNIQSKDSFLIYQNQHLLHVSETKLHIYRFKILANTKPNRIDISSVDSIQIPKDPKYLFFDCLEMLNGNFVLFYQINPKLNYKTKGEIQYIICATSKISIEQKLGQIFKFKSANELKHLSQNQFQKIQQKCDIAFKIGLSRRQIYLKLWNLSNKRDIQDYKFLLDTMDYETIKVQIQKKLKKSSMSFNQVYKLEQSCFDILRTDVFSNTDCTEQSIKNYLISHFLLRKLAFFRDTQQRAKRIQNQQNKVFTINVQQYFYCVNLDLKACLLDYAFKICFEDKDCSRELRLFINSFKFPLRWIYLDILSDLIAQSKRKLINLLVILPQMLPYMHKEVPDSEDLSLYQGLWSEIKNQQWKSSLHLEQIVTIYNKELVDEVTKSVWFKRNQYTLHDLVAFSKPKIIEMQELNSSDIIFYHFIDQIFRHNKQVQTLNEIIEFLQINYQLLPPHLKGKIFLYKKLFDYFKHERYYSSALAQFNVFLKLKDYQLFKQLFKYEKIKKGCLLKDAKSIYASIPNGNTLYNQALLNYFISDLSEVSDLKYILNRLNNEKRQFHIENESIYEVLVRAMQMKLRLGSENDVPFEQVMIYMQNIPFSKNNPIIEELNTVQIIGQCSQMFSKMKLNMTFLQIIQRCEDVLSAMINEQIKQKKVLEMRDIMQLKNATYVILAQIQTIKEKIYKGKLNNLAYFIYISRLMEEQHLIKDAKLLLEDPFLLEYYSVDDKIVQNLVIYMYRWKLAKEPAFVDNEKYLYELLTLLPEDNIYKIYFKAEIQFSIMLSTPQHPIQFTAANIEQIQDNGPTPNQNLITTKQIVEIVNNLPAEFLAALNLQRMYELTKTIQQLCFTEDDYLKMTNLVEIYEAVIIRLIHLKSIRVVLPKVRKLIQLYGQEQNYSIVFGYIILNLIMAEISENHKKDMAKIAFYTFNHPLKLLDIIEQLINNKFSNDEEADFIQKQLESLRPNKCYNRNNFLLAQEISSKLNEKEEKYYHKFEELIFQTWIHINNNRQDFNKNLDYTFYYICLLHNPYALAKFLHVLQDSVNIRVLRSYLSYIFREEIFNGINVLYFSRRMFITLLDSVMDQIPIEFVISQYRGVDIQQQQVYPALPPNIEDINPFAAKLGKSIKAFSNKIDSLSKLQPEESNKKKTRIEALLSSDASINEKQVSEYPFNDSDDNYEAEQVEVNYVHSPNKVKRKPSRIFDANRERKMLMERKDKNLFLSCNDKEDFELRRNNSSNYLQNLMKSMEHCKSKKGGQRDKLQGGSRRDNQLFHILDRIDRADSNPGASLEEHSLMEVHSQTQDDFLFSMQPIVLEQKQSQDPIKSSNVRSCNPFPTLQKDFQPDSPIKITGFHNNDANQLQQESPQKQQWQFKITINVANDDEYTPIWELSKQLLKDYGGNDTKPMFNLSLIAAQQQKQFGRFEQYLKELIVCLYESNEKSVSFLLTLIKQIVHEYCEIVQASSEFLEYYISLQNYNIKYKYHLPIRQMFPIEGIFLQSTDPKVLFQYNKHYILKHVDFDNILLVAKLLHFSFKRGEIKDQLYFTYLITAIEHYGNDGETNQEELVMQKQRIGGIIDQIATVNIFVEKGELLLMEGNNERKKEVIQLIKDSLSKRKKNDVLKEFCLKFKCP